MKYSPFAWTRNLLALGLLSLGGTPFTVAQRDSAEAAGTAPAAAEITNRRLKAAVGTGYTQAKSGIMVEASPRFDGQRHQIWFRMLNATAQDVSITPMDEPWTSFATTVVVLYDLTQQKLIPRDRFYFKDPPLGEVNILPGKSVEGGAFLWEFAPDVEERLKQSEVLVFWYYKGRNDNPAIPPQGGWFVVERTDAGATDGAAIRKRDVQPADADSGSLKVDLFLIPPDNGKLRIKCRVENTSTRALTVRDGDLPWKAPDALIVAAHRVRGGRAQVAELGPASHSDVASLTLSPGQSIEAVLNTEKGWPFLDSEAAASDIVVFWSYRGHTTAGAARQGGWLFVPKTGTAN